MVLLNNAKHPVDALMIEQSLESPMPLSNQPQNDLTTFFEASSLPTIILDSQLRVHFLNKAAATMLDQDEATLIGQEIGVLIPAIDAISLRDHQVGGSGDVTFSLQHQRRSWDGIATRLVSERGEVRLVLRLRNWTAAQKHAAEYADLLRFAIHDLINLLNIPLNHAELLHDGELSGEEAELTQHISLQYLRRMKYLLEDLRTIEEVKEDVTLTFKRLQLPLLVAEVMDCLQDRAAEHDIQLDTVSAPDEFPLVIGNETLLRQAIYNLVENAIKYTLAGGWVRVAFNHDRSAQKVEIHVADNGIGIHPDKQAGLFSPFYRVDNPRAAHINGTGLGLNLVQMVAERHYGDVAFSSTPDEGSTFTIRLPISHEEVSEQT